MKKTYPNDPCPCGSGKKFKYCHGSNIRSFNGGYAESDLQVADFVYDKISEDIAFLQDALQLILGSDGYSYCNENQNELEEEYKKDGLKSYVRSDKMKVTAMAAHSDTKNRVLEVSPYIGQIPDEAEDIMSLLKQGHICVEGRQVELFHAYLLDRLSARFKDYLYVPAKKAIQEQKFGAFAHRGYDFLLGITLYLELQLGVHVYLCKMNPEMLSAEDKNACINYFVIKQISSENKGILPLLSGYKEVIEKQISKEYDAAREVELYRSIGAYAPEEYPSRKAVITPGYLRNSDQQFDYIAYLKYLVPAICFNHPGFFMWACHSFPQCDIVKYLSGLEAVVKLFQQQIKEEYHNAVFFMTDERYGMCMPARNEDFVYDDSADFDEDEFSSGDFFLNYAKGSKQKNPCNPARKTIRRKPVKKLVMNMYNTLNGQFFSLEAADTRGTEKGYKIIGKYPMLPWISSGKEKTVHCGPVDWKEKNYADLYSEDIKRRQYFLDIEYRLEEIPVNCVEEFLIPEVFYKWTERNDLLKETQEKNEELKALNDDLEKHIQLNSELVRSLSHSAANYLDTDSLAQIGMELREAKRDDPTVEELWSKGGTLLLQSEREMYLTRQLNSLVLRCSSDVEKLQKKIREGLSREDGAIIWAPIDFALKTVLTRVLFRDGDRRSEFIRDKIMGADDDKHDKWIQMKSSFMLDVLANDNASDDATIAWWKKHIGDIDITTSYIWNSVRLIKDKDFYDLIVEITTELIMNALSHGDMTAGVSLELGQAEEHQGNPRHPRWTFISCKNTVGNRYAGGRREGVSTLSETMRLLNNKDKGIDRKEENGFHECKVWITATLFKLL